MYTRSYMSFITAVVYALVLAGSEASNDVCDPYGSPTFYNAPVVVCPSVKYITKTNGRNVVSYKQLQIGFCGGVCGMGNLAISDAYAANPCGWGFITLGRPSFNAASKSVVLGLYNFNNGVDYHATINATCDDSLPSDTASCPLEVREGPDAAYRGRYEGRTIQMQLFSSLVCV